MTTIDEIVRTVGETAQYVGGNLAGHVGGGAGENPSGEDRIEADDWADGIFFDELSTIDGVGAYGSEERPAVVDCGDGYSVAIDPLDGSSNLVVNAAVGTIVGVYDAPIPAVGRDLVAATMVLYGPFTTMVVARQDRDGVREYLLRDGFLERWRTRSIPDSETVVGLAGKPGERSEALDAVAAELERELKLRYGGATVADLAQVLEYGGLFGYPATGGYPDGKLRVHFESAPLAYIVEAAGGASSDGNQSLLDVEPDDLHARTPTYLGNEALIDRLEAALAE